jgi:hypothetical protein
MRRGEDMPDLELERAAGGLVAGVDEAGRGPWAGPVVAAAVILERGGVGLLDGIEESKRLTRARRAELFTVLKGSARLGIGAASVPEIDRLNILQATLLAMARAIRALGVTPDLALIDGPHAPDLPCPVRTVVRGAATRSWRAWRGAIPASAGSATPATAHRSTRRRWPASARRRITAGASPPSSTS